MRIPSRPSVRSRERGGVTIMVALMMLVFITIVAVGMSRNSFREIVTSGTSRQGAMARNVADSGIEWSIYWMDLTNSTSATGGAANLVAMKAALLADGTLAGRAWDVMSGTPTVPTSYTPGSNVALTLPTITTSTGTTLTQTLSAGITRMGKLPIADISQSVGTGAYAPATGQESNQAPDLWAVRTDAQVKTGAVTFVHAKEVWVSTPVQ